MTAVIRDEVISNKATIHGDVTVDDLLDADSLTVQHDGTIHGDLTVDGTLHADTLTFDNLDVTNGTFHGDVAIDGHLGVHSAGVSTASFINVPAGTTSVVPIRIARGVLATVSTCGNFMYDGHFAMDMCGGLRNYVDGTFYIQAQPINIPDLGDGVAQSMIAGTNPVGTRILPNYSFNRIGKLVRLKNKSILTFKNNSKSTMIFTLGTHTVTSDVVTYDTSATNTYGEIEIDLYVDNIYDHVCDIKIYGRTLYLKGGSGSTVYSRYIHAEILGFDYTIAHDIDIKFLWDVATHHDDNIISTRISTLQYMD